MMPRPSKANMSIKTARDTAMTMMVMAMMAFIKPNTIIQTTITKTRRMVGNYDDGDVDDGDDDDDDDDDNMLIV